MDKVRTEIEIAGFKVMVEISETGIRFVDESGEYEYHRLDILQALVDAKD